MSTSSLTTALLDSLPGIVYATDREGRIQFANRRFAAVSGEAAEALIGRRLEDVLPLYLVEQALEHERHVNELSMPIVRQIEGRGPSGVERTWLVNKFPLQGEAEGIGTVIADVTDQVRESATARREALFSREVLDRVPNLIYAKDRGRRFTLANRAMASLMESTPEQMLGRTTRELGATGELADRLEREDAVVLEGGADTLTPEESRFDAQGTERWFRTTRQPLRLEDADAEQLLVVATEITEYRNAQRERLRLKDERMDAVGRLSGGIAHDLNNLLTVLQSGADILQDAVGPDSEVSFVIDGIARASARAATLTRHLLAYGRRQLLRPRGFDLNEVILAERERLGEMVGDGVELSVVLETQPCPVFVDREGMVQALLHLVSNAMDAMGDGGGLRIETRRLGGRLPGAEVDGVVELAVEDTGAGIPAELADRVFEPFFTTKAQGKGTGLGLSMVYGMVRQSGGDVALADGEGQGARIVIQLPLALEPSVRTDADAIESE